MISKLILSAAVAATVALLLAGCQQGKHKENKASTIEQPVTKMDSAKEDTMEAFYKRMRRHSALYPNTPLDK